LYSKRKGDKEMDESAKQVHRKTQNEINCIIQSIGAKQELLSLQGRVNYFRKRMLEFCDSIEQDAKLKYTGWYVLLKKEENGWKCLGTYNPDKCSEEEELELEKPEMGWDICLPIPTPETIKEFIGW